MKEITILLFLFFVIPTAYAQEYPEYGVGVEAVAENLRIPWSIDWLPGVAVDPKYSENNYIYIYYTYNEFLSTTNKLVRYHLENLTLTEDKVLLDGIPGGPFHDGGRIQFGPDGKLYVTTGEAANPGLSQDMNSLGGKILRINSDGSIPQDNPFSDSAIFSIGHRNPQGIDWDDSGNLVSTEHGPSGWRGVARDEVNVITPGSNYG